MTSAKRAARYNFGWANIFLFLMAFAIVPSILIIKLLPETHHAPDRKRVSVVEVALSLLKDKKVVGFGLLVGACNGISFSYYGCNGCRKSDTD